MAGETTTTSLNDIVYSAWIDASLIDYAYDWVVAQQFFDSSRDLIGKPGGSIQIPTVTSNMGTVGANGAGVDTEFDTSEAADLTATQLATSNVTISVSEYGLNRELTDDVEEDSINGLDLMNRIMQDASRVLMTAIEYSCLSLFGAATNTVGTTGVDLTIAQMLAAHEGIRTRGYHAPDGVVYVLDDQQKADIDTATLATGTTFLTYGGMAMGLLGVSPTANNGMGNGHVFNFRGYPVYATGLGPTANAGADVTGGCFIPATRGNSAAGHVSFARVEKRLMRMEPDRDASKRTSEAVFTTRVGVGALVDGSTTGIITDAP